VRDDRFAGETMAIGGPDVVSMEELLRRVRHARGRGDGRVLHVPLGLLQPPLRVAEAMGLGRLLPTTAGQLSSFRFDGIAGAERHGDQLIGLSEMLSEDTGDSAEHDLRLDAECRVLTRHLLKREPDAYVTAQYQQAIAAMPALSTTSRLDERLLAVARRPLASFTCMACSSRIRRCASALLLLAILETRPPFSQRIDQGIGGSTTIVIVRLGLTALGAALSLLAGTLIFLPVRVVSAFGPKDPR
jgi:hypothetical protein